MEEKTRAFARIWTGYYQRRETHPAEVEALQRRLTDYDGDLRALGMDDHEIDRPPAIVNVWLGLLLLLQAPWFTLHAADHAGRRHREPAARGCILWLVTRWASKTQKDEASIKTAAR
ncbi:MAG: hypothetical protein R3B82_24825 [Sandaracinaceae bacterium]